MVARWHNITLLLLREFTMLMVRESSVGVGDGGVGGVGGSDNIVTIKSFLPPTHGNALLR